MAGSLVARVLRDPRLSQGWSEAPEPAQSYTADTSSWHRPLPWPSMRSPQVPRTTPETALWVSRLRSVVHALSSLGRILPPPWMNRSGSTNRLNFLLSYTKRLVQFNATWLKQTRNMRSVTSHLNTYFSSPNRLALESLSKDWIGRIFRLLHRGRTSLTSQIYFPFPASTHTRYLALPTLGILELRRPRWRKVFFYLQRSGHMRRRCENHPFAVCTLRWPHLPHTVTVLPYL